MEKNNNTRTSKNKAKRKKNKNNKRIKTQNTETIQVKLVSSSPRPSTLSKPNGKFEFKRSSGSEFEDFQTPSIEYDIKNEDLEENNLVDISPDYDKEWEEMGSFKGGNLENIVELDQSIHKDRDNCNVESVLTNGDVVMEFTTNEQTWENHSSAVVEKEENEGQEIKDNATNEDRDQSESEKFEDLNQEISSMRIDEFFGNLDDECYSYPVEESLNTTTVKSMNTESRTLPHFHEPFKHSDEALEKQELTELSPEISIVMCTDENLSQEYLRVEKIVFDTVKLITVRKSMTLQSTRSATLSDKANMSASKNTNVSDDNIPHISVDKKEKTNMYRNFINKFKKDKSPEKHQRKNKSAFIFKVKGAHKEEFAKDKSPAKESVFKTKEEGEFIKENIESKEGFVNKNSPDKEAIVEKNGESEFKKEIITTEGEKGVDKEESLKEVGIDKEKSPEVEHFQNENFEENLSVQSICLVKDSEIESNQSQMSLNNLDNISHTSPTFKSTLEVTNESISHVNNVANEDRIEADVDKKVEINKKEKSKSFLKILKRKHKIKKQSKTISICETLPDNSEAHLKPNVGIYSQVIKEFNDTVKSMMCTDTVKGFDETVVAKNNKQLQMDTDLDPIMEQSANDDFDADDHLFPDAITATKILGSKPSDVPYMDDSLVHEIDCISFYNGESKRLRMSPEFYVPKASMESLYFPGDSMKNEGFRKSLISHSPSRRKRVLGNILGCMSRGR